MTDKKLIKLCIKQDGQALEELYNRFSPKLFGICLRYGKNVMEAEDILHDGFVRIINNLKSYRHEGSLEGWLRRVMVTTAINHYNKKSLNSSDVEVEDVPHKDIYVDDIVSQITTKELLKVINGLPEGYRIVFNLYAIEGYSHKEIADKLGVSESTSKTQLLKARKMLRRIIVKEKKIVYEKTA